MKPLLVNRIFMALSAVLLIGLINLHPGGPVTEGFAQSASLLPGTINECGVENNTFLDGEEIVYKVYYNWGFFWTEAGMVHFKVHETDSTYNISASGSTAGFYDNFYRVRDTFMTQLDKTNLMPTLFERDVEEGKYRKYNKFIFDHGEKSITSYEGNNRHAELERKQIEFTNCMHDVLSVVYNLRNTDVEQMKPGETFEVDVFLEEHYPIEVKVVDMNKPKKVRGLGRFNAHVIQPELIAGEVFTEDSYMTIYVSADENRLPLVLESPRIVGNMKAILYDVKGLKYDLDAKLN